MPLPIPLCPQIVSSASTDLQDYTYYFVPAPWLSVKLLRLLQCYPPPGTNKLTRARAWGPLTPRLARGRGARGLCPDFPEAGLVSAAPDPRLQWGQCRAHGPLRLWDEYVVEAGRGRGGGHLQQGALPPAQGTDRWPLIPLPWARGPVKPDSRPGPGTLGLLSPLSYR